MRLCGRFLGQVRWFDDSKLPVDVWMCIKGLYLLFKTLFSKNSRQRKTAKIKVVQDLNWGYSRMRFNSLCNPSGPVDLKKSSGRFESKWSEYRQQHVGWSPAGRSPLARQHRLCSVRSSRVERWNYLFVKHRRHVGSAGQFTLESLTPSIVSAVCKSTGIYKYIPDKRPAPTSELLVFCSRRWYGTFQPWAGGSEPTAAYVGVLSLLSKLCSHCTVYLLAAAMQTVIMFPHKDN